MNRRFFALLLFALPLCALATPPGVLRLDAKAPMAEGR